MKPKSCRICKKKFEPRATTQVVCSPVCAVHLLARKKIAKEKDAAKAERKSDRERKEKLKSVREVLGEAQVFCNQVVRARDEGKPCISCGRHANVYDAGHDRSTAAAPHLRFNLDNIHAQCVPCNQHKSGNAVEYRIGLVRRIGITRVEALENNNEVRKVSMTEAVSIREFWREEAKRTKNSKKT